MTGIYPSDMADGIVDDSESFWKVRDKMKWPVGLCEGSFYQTNDNIIHLLLRSNENHLWVTESSDDGATWSTPVSTEFTDNATKFHFGKLPDGRFYYVGCPDPQPRGQRNPLVLSLSNDGVIFNYHAIIADEKYDMKYPGMHKGGDYGYPHTMIHAGYLYVIVSRQKEAVEVLRVKISGLHNFFHI
jgi:outer membrane protein assembly factor BamB